MNKPNRILISALVVTLGFFILTLGAGLVVPLSSGAAVAQETSDNNFDVNAFDTQARRAEDVIDRGEASTQAFETLRATLFALRTAARAAENKNNARLATINQQLLALGQKPDEGAQEAQEIADRRTILQEQLAQARAPVIANAEAYRRADGLIKEIDSLIHKRRTEALLTLESSPLFPRNWIAALTESSVYITALGGRIGTAMDSQTRRVVIAQNLPVILGLSAVGLFLLLRARRWIIHLIGLNDARKVTRMQALVRFALSLSLLVIPVIGLFLITAAIDLLSILEGRDEFIIHALRSAGVIILAVHWLANFLFSTGSHNQTASEFTENPGDTATLPGRRSAMFLGGVLAFAVLLQQLSKGAGLTGPAHAALIFPFALLGGIGLVRLGNKFGVYISKEDTVAPFNVLERRLFGILIKFCYMVGVAGPILAGIGYFQAGSRLIFASISSLALIGAGYILLQLVIQISRGFSAPITFQIGQQDQRKSWALFRILLGFAFISASLPLFALIWGARPSDLSEMWIWLRDGVTLGETRLSLVGFLYFILIFAVGYSLTRLLQSILRTVVLPNTSLDTGASNALITGLGYLGVFLAGLAAITATGIDLSNLALVAGALSVGIGFGLQAVVSNFVSGIILLIERPIKEGDWIDVAGNSGYVRRISVRSTSIDTFDRATVIVPNADLIAGTVTNWTHNNMSGRVKVPVGVSYDSDPREVEQILLDIAKAHPMVLRDPAPHIIFTGFGASSMDFEIRAILRDVNWMLSAHSDMNFEIVKRFRDAGIEIPFPQRDLNVRNIGALADVMGKDIKSEAT